MRAGGEAVFTGGCGKGVGLAVDFDSQAASFDVKVSGVVGVALLDGFLLLFCVSHTHTLSLSLSLSLSLPLLFFSLSLSLSLLHSFSVLFFKNKKKKGLK